MDLRLRRLMAAWMQRQAQPYPFMEATTTAAAPAATTTAPQTTTQEGTTTNPNTACGLLVSGAGTANANQLYCIPTEDLYNGEAYYNGMTNAQWQIRYGDSPGKWAIMDTGISKYEADTLLGTWAETGGDAPAPTVVEQCTCPEPIATTTEAAI